MALKPNELAAIDAATIAYRKWRKRPWPPVERVQLIPYQGVVIIVATGHPPLIETKGKIKHACRHTR